MPNNYCKLISIREASMITLPTTLSNTGYFPMTTKSILVKRQQTKRLTHRVNTSSPQTLSGQTTRVGSVSLDISTCQFYRHLHHNSHLHHGPCQYVYCVPKEIHISLISTNPALLQGKPCFYYRALKSWNKLSVATRHSSSLAQFKRSARGDMRSAGK